MSKKVHIITRTSGRPNFFKICRSSVKQQTYNNINHIVVVDDAHKSPVRSKEVPWHVGNNYVQEYEGIQPINIQWEDFKESTIPGKPFGAEQGLNYALEVISEEDYFCILDDDDFFTSPKTIEIALDNIKDGDILFWQVYAASAIVPDKNHMYGKSKSLPYGQVSMIGWLVKKSFIGNAKFNPIYGGDADFIKQITGGDVTTSNIKWLNGLYSATNPMRPQGEGFCKDIDLQTALNGFKKRSEGFMYDIL